MTFNNKSTKLECKVAYIRYIKELRLVIFEIFQAKLGYDISLRLLEFCMFKDEYCYLPNIPKFLIKYQNKKQKIE